MKSQKAHSCHSRGSGNPGSGFNQSFHYAFFLIKTMKNQYIRISIVGMFAILAVLSLNTVGNAQPTISYQGFIQNNGTPVNGSTTLKILIYDVATGGSPFYTETQTVNVANGIFNVMIGAVTPLQPALDFTKQYYLALSINGGAELTPRSLVSFSPYAFRALNADTSSYATTAGRATLANGISGGYVENVNGDNGNLTISGANGITVTNNSPNLVIGNSGVQSLDGTGGILTLVGAGGTAVTRSGSTITITSTGTGTAGVLSLLNADTTITIKNPNGPIDTIGLAPQNAINGQVLAWNGSAWRPRTLSGESFIDSIKDLQDARDDGSSVQLGAGSGENNSGKNSNAALGIGSLHTNTTGYSNASCGDSSLYLNTSGKDNAALGDSVLFANTTGSFNTAVGWSALYSNTTGQSNTANGYEALFSNTTGSGNNACGWGALQFNTTSNGSSAFGHEALHFQTSGETNSAFGYFALLNDTSGTDNDAFGFNSLNNNHSGSYNAGFGDGTLQRSENASNNTAVGYYSMELISSGWSNVGVGCASLLSNFNRGNLVAVGDSALFWNDGSISNLLPTGDSATENTGLGSKALYTNRTGAYNTATGYQALYSNYTGYYNNADGVKALWSNSSGNYNTATGYQALTASTTGSFNTAYGYLALQQNTTGSNNAAFGDNTGPTTSALSNTTCLGSGAQASSSNEVVIGNASVASLYCQGAYAATTAASANMVVTSSGQIMRSTSSARYKTDIHDLDINTDKLYDLRPVSYISKIDGKPYFGLVAEDVAKVIPDLAEYARSKDVIPGSTSDALIPDAVKYPMLSVLLLEELKKEHSKVESQSEQLEAQSKINSDLERRLEALESAQKATR